MGHFYYVRHGQTEWTVENKVCGASDSILTDFGHQQAIETGKKFLEQGIKADEILYSPLKRTTETARHISEITGIPMRPEPRIVEQNFGDWEGASVFDEGFQKEKRQFTCSFRCGESAFQVAQRIYNVLDELKEASKDKTYILVAHNGLARVITSYFKDMDNEEYSSFSIENCSITRFDF